MPEAWFVIVSLLLAAYVVLDGFDLGAGAIHRYVAHTDAERREVIAAIGPFWDGNEVFLLAAGGALFVAFPRVLGAALSGLYLAVILVLWGIVLRGASIELRSHLRDGLWRAFWDAVFQGSSAALALLLGVALGNVLRGFPLEPDGTFELDLFSVGSPRAPRGMIDGYTLATGVFGLAVLVVHGARFVAMRTDGPVRARCAALGNRAMVPVAILWAAVTALSFRYAPGAVTMRPLVAALIATALASFGLSWQRARSGDVRTAFLASAGQIFALVGAAAASAYPVLLRSTRAGVPSLTVANAASPDEALQAGLSWWFVAAALVVLYFGNLFRVHRGRAATYGEGAEP